MELLFAVIFIIGNIGLYYWADKQLSENNSGNSNMFMKGAVRGCEGRVDSSGKLEQMRKRVNRKGSKF